MAKITEIGLVKAGSKMLQSGFTTRFIRKTKNNDDIDNSNIPDEEKSQRKVAKNKSTRKIKKEENE